MSNYQVSPTDSVWAYSTNSGIAANNSDVTNNNPAAPDGTQVAFVQNSGLLSEIWSAAAGTYTLSFKAAQRGSGNDSYQQLRVNLRSSSAAASAKTFVWDGNMIAEERDGSGSNVTKRFFAEGEQRIGGSDAGNYYYSRDHLGSIREITDATGALKAQYDYDAWGDMSTVSGNMTPSFGYTGHYYHQPSNLSLAMYRAYNPALGRWISRDPLKDAEMSQGANLYWYAANSPLERVDPLGLDIAVVIGYGYQPTSPFGHVAAAVTGRGVFSYGTRDPFGSSFTDYLQSQSSYRGSVVFILPTTPDQDSAFVAAFEKITAKGKSGLAHDCADAVAAGLKAAGLLDSNAAQTLPSLINDYMGLRVINGQVSAVITIPSGISAQNPQWNELNQLIGSFNPQLSGGH